MAGLLSREENQEKRDKKKQLEKVKDGEGEGRCVGEKETMLANIREKTILDKEKEKKEDRDTTEGKEGISALSGNLVVYTMQQV